MSKEEMLQIIDNQKQQIFYLSTKIDVYAKQKDQLIDSFKLSSSVLLERIKDLEA